MQIGPVRIGRVRRGPVRILPVIRLSAAACVFVLVVAASEGSADYEAAWEGRESEMGSADLPAAGR